MKKFASAAAPAQNEENVKTTLTVVTAEGENLNGEQPATEGQQTSEETAKAETQKTVTAIPLEERRKIIESLHRMNVKLDRVKEDLDKLNDFEIELKEEPENTESAYFNGCSLTVTDDKGHRYAVKNPNLVAASVELLKKMYGEKIAEIESEIVWPA